MWRAEMAAVERWCIGKGLDPGAGGRTFSPDVVRLDRRPDSSRQIGADACALPFSDATFDFVLTSHLIEHLARPRAALDEWLRVVRPGGHVISIIPDTRFTRGMNTDPTPHLHEWSPGSFLMDVLDCSPDGAWWARSIRVIGEPWDLAECLVACLNWSFAVMLRKAG
jgi:SAM-dependent methyltransferase